MSQTLIAGANAALPTGEITIRIMSERPIDCAAYRLTASGKVRGDGDMVFYGQTHSDDGSIKFRGHETDGFFDIHLADQTEQIDKIALALSSDYALEQVGDVDIQVMQGGEVILTCHVQAAGRSEKALILAECYRRQGGWKFRFISQGFDGGLKPLSEYFGVNIAPTQPVQTPAPPPLPLPTVSESGIKLTKITLTKDQSSINLKKKANFGQISINLDWNRRPDKAQLPKKGRLSELFSQHSKGVDLDIGAMIHLQSGEKTLIQALGGRFGSLQSPPYVCLREDDRTGQLRGGEWLDINGQNWDQINEVVIFAFIYEGAPNWLQTDGVVTIHVPQQPPIETCLTEGTNSRPMCAIARLVNQQGSINVERINRYFKGHQDMDRAFGWGFSWQKARK